jgi:DNA polymerase III subunit beta
MKIKILQENLTQALGYLSKAIPGKPQLPILSSVLLQARDGEVMLSATDLYFGVRAKLTADSSEAGEVVIPGRQFKEVIATLPPGEMVLNYKDGILQVKAGSIKANLQCHKSDDYPPFPQSEGDDYQLAGSDLELVEKMVSFSASLDQTRPVLTSLLFDFSDSGLKVVGTDGFRLSSLVANGSSHPTAGRFLLPAKAFNEVYRITSLTAAKKVVFKVSGELKQAFVSVGGVEIFVRLIDGEYPPYEKIIPTTFSTEVVFETEELIENLKRAMIFARESSNIVRFSVETNSVKVGATSPTIGSYDGELKEVEVKGQSGEIAFNAKYILDYLAAVKEEKVWFGMSESLKPAMFKVDSLTAHQYVVMPFKVNG